MARIIVIEDESSTRTLVTAVLKKLGHQVSAFDNGAEGLLMIMAELPDLVVSDVQMPKMTGFEVLAQVRREADTLDMPFILLTSLSDRADMRHGLSQGASDYITKPFQPAELVESVTQLLTRSALRQGKALGLVADEPVEQGAPIQPVPAPAAPEMGLAELEPAQDSLRETDRRVGTAWLVQIEVHNADELSARLSTKDWRAILRQLFLPASRDPHLRQAQFLDMAEQRLTLTFCDAAFGAEVGAAALAAAHAIKVMMLTSGATREWVAQTYGSALPPLRTVISMHHGEIGIRSVPLPYGGMRDAVVGDAAELSLRLRHSEPAILWKVLATEAAYQASQGLYKTGAHMEVSIGRHEVQVHALQGLQGGETSWI